MKNVRRILFFTLAIALFICAPALAAGGKTWVNSSANGAIPLASYVGDYDGWVDIAGFGGITAADSIKVAIVSRNASVWAQPRTNSTKLGTAQHGEELPGNADGNGRIAMRDGFYSVTYKGKQGWVNSAYAVVAPLEIVLMEGNVPAYCAPDRRAKRVGSLNKLTRYTVLGFYDDFYVVSLREAAAFIPMSVKHYDTTFERYYHASLSGRGKTVRKTAMRCGPGHDYASAGDMGAGKGFTFFDVINGWCLLHDDSTNCFVYIDADDTDIQG